MNKRTLGVLAIILIALIAVVLFAGLDHLPRSLRSSVEAASTRVVTDRTQFNEARAAINGAIGKDPDLFRTQAALWQSRLLQGDNKLKQTEAEVSRLKELAKANKREDSGKVQAELARIETMRAGTVQEAQNLRTEAERWLGYKRNLPEQLSSMRANYESLKAFNPSQQAATAQKAMVDWPQKKDDLERRLKTIDALKQQGEEAWASTAGERSQAEANNLAGLDYAKLFAAGEAIAGDLREVQRGATTADSLAGQLYVGRDKMLLELDDDDGRKQKVRVVETRYADSALTNPSTASREEWENVDANRFDQLKKSIGMVVERKPAGKFDSEAEKMIQPPGYAYVAPPGQANQYGSWNNGVWSWLPQYLILSQLLRTSSVPPISTGNYYDYDQARRRGNVWYGRNGEYGSTWSRNSGTVDRLRRWGSGTSSQGGGTISSGSTRPREGWNTGGSTFGGSKYESRGGFGGSRYQSRPGSGGSGFGSRSYSRGGSFGRGFGRGGRR